MTFRVFWTLAYRKGLIDNTPNLMSPDKMLSTRHSACKEFGNPTMQGGTYIIPQFTSAQKYAIF